MYNNVDPLSQLHTALGHAQYQGFPEIEYEDRDWELFYKTKEDRRIKKSRLHSPWDISVFAMFAQSWPSTALGFGGLGGQAITTTYSIVLESDVIGEFCVYFGGRFAYRVEKPTTEFFDDIVNRRLVKVSECKKYERIQ